LVDDNRTYAQVLEEYTSDGSILVSYVYGNDLISQQRGDQVSYYHVDAIGSTRFLTNASGTVTDTYQYDSYGQALARIGNTLNVYLFAGEQRDDQTGLDYLRARYLNPSIGRFISRDSFEGYRDSPETINKYVYANANPIEFTDPSGNVSLSDVMIAASIVTLIGIDVTLFSLNYVSRYKGVVVDRPFLERVVEKATDRFFETNQALSPLTLFGDDAEFNVLALGRLGLGLASGAQVANLTGGTTLVPFIVDALLGATLTNTANGTVAAYTRLYTVSQVASAFAINLVLSTAFFELGLLFGSLVGGVFDAADDVIAERNGS
jgi:RHS repeat-associated protein